MQLSTAEFFLLFLSAVSKFHPEGDSPAVNLPDTSQQDLLPEYDFLIVGAGSAGCVLANRLSEVESWKVLLIEAGGDEDAITDTPFLYQYLQNTEKDWNYTSVQQQRACLVTDGVCACPRGRVMGGSSSVNYMNYVRGNRADYDGWAADGNTGWSYEDVLPYFIKLENNTIPELQESTYHGRDGYLNVQYPEYRYQLQNSYIQAGVEFGLEEGDYNGERQNVIGKAQVTLNGPSRESTSKAYLNPIMHRSNLHIIKHSEVTKLILDGRKAIGVEYIRDNRIRQVFAEKEVILSAGSINSPKLLMLSGIGPKHELQRHNITVVADLPVGEELQDHVLVGIDFQINSNKTIIGKMWKSNSSIYEYARERKGPLIATGYSVNAFTNVFDKASQPNLQIIFFETLNKDFSQNKSIISLHLGLIGPKSKGWLKLRSNDWRDDPLINPNYLSEIHDRIVLQRGLELVLGIMETPIMTKLEPKIYNKYYPDCEQSLKSAPRKEYFTCLVEKYSTTYYHTASTVKMGPLQDKSSVVTPDLLVKGFDNLRVIDASIFPRLPSGNTNAPTIMVAEKGADIIKQCHYLIQ